MMVMYVVHLFHPAKVRHPLVLSKKIAATGERKSLVLRHASDKPVMPDCPFPSDRVDGYVCTGNDIIRPLEYRDLSTDHPDG